MISAVILYYDYLLTFDLEYDRFWKRPKITIGGLLFFFVRYGSLIGHIPVIAHTFVPISSLGSFQASIDLMSPLHILITTVMTTGNVC